jgi:uncharacterized damage-inducible protein DinB
MTQMLEHLTADLVQELIDQSIRRIEDNTPRILKCLTELSQEEIWNHPNESSNSVGNIILHICGNVTQYILSSLGGIEDIRERDKEFNTTGGITKHELINRLTGTLAQAVKIIGQQSEESLMKKRMVQGFQLSGIGIIVHVVEHYSYHTGQIAFWTKLLKNKDLAFYGGTNLNTRNSM